MSKGKNKKRRRDKKVSKGINGGGGKTKLTTVQKALLGGGILHSPGPASSRSKPKTKVGKGA